MAFARILVFAIALTHAVGLADLVLDDACGETCSDDGCSDGCLPDVACRCHCPSTMPLLGGTVQAVAAPIPSDRELDPASVDQRMHASPDPREILHVPRHVV